MGGWLVIEGDNRHLLWGKANLSQKSFGQSQGRGSDLGFGGGQDSEIGQGEKGREQRRGKNQNLLRELARTELDEAVANMDELYAEANDCKERLAREVYEKQQALLKQSAQLELDLEETETAPVPAPGPEPEPAKQSTRWRLRRVTKPKQQKLEEDPGLFDNSR